MRLSSSADINDSEISSASSPIASFASLASNSSSDRFSSSEPASLYVRVFLGRPRRLTGVDCRLDLALFASDAIDVGGLFLLPEGVTLAEFLRGLPLPRFPIIRENAFEAGEDSVSFLRGLSRTGRDTVLAVLREEPRLGLIEDAALMDSTSLFSRYCLVSMLLFVRAL